MNTKFSKKILEFFPNISKMLFKIYFKFATNFIQDYNFPNISKITQISLYVFIKCNIVGCNREYYGHRYILDIYLLRKRLDT